MTEERDKSSRGKESLARTTARDVPFVRGAGSDSEPAPRGQRPAQLPRDPTYEAELAQVELAVLRDPVRRDDPSTRQGGGRRAHQLVHGQPPESVTPESPGTRASPEVAHGRSPEPPSSGRAVASGTLLSVGTVDPRGKTERTLETPRMFFSQPEDGAEAYFRPGKIPAVTVHQTIETETVKLSDSIDPRRAKTIPRLDRAALARLAALEGEPDSEASFAISQPASNFDEPASAASPPWNEHDYDPSSSLREHDGQIHASLSMFRDQGEPSFTLDGAATRPEPYVLRRDSDAPSAPSAPDPSVIPTQRDLPAHRIEASRPPPAPKSTPTSARSEHSESNAPASEVASPTTASIAAQEPERRPPWLNYAAFLVALLLATGLGLWLTSDSSSQSAAPDGAPSAAPVGTPAEPTAPEVPAAPPKAAVPVVEPPAPVGQTAQAPQAPAPARKPSEAQPPKPVDTSPARATQQPAPRKSTPSKSSRETIF